MQLSPSEADITQLLNKFPTFMEPGASLSGVQERATGACPEPQESSPYPTTLSLRSIFKLSSHIASVSQMVSSFQASQPKLFTHFSSTHACHVSQSSQPLWFDHPNNIWWRVKIMDLPITHLPPAFGLLTNLGPNALFSTTIWIIPCSFFNMTAHVSTHTKQQVRLQLRIFLSVRSQISDGKTNILNATEANTLRFHASFCISLWMLFWPLPPCPDNSS